LHLPESEPLWQAGRGFVVRGWRSGVSAAPPSENKRNICGGLPPRRYEEEESSAGSLKIRTPGTCRTGNYFPASEVFGEGKRSVRPATMNSPSPW